MFTSTYVYRYHIYQNWKRTCLLSNEPLKTAINIFNKNIIIKCGQNSFRIHQFMAVPNNEKLAIASCSKNSARNSSWNSEFSWKLLIKNLKPSNVSIQRSWVWWHFYNNVKIDSSSWKKWFLKNSNWNSGKKTQLILAKAGERLANFISSIIISEWLLHGVHVRTIRKVGNPSFTQKSFLVLMA